MDSRLRRAVRHGSQDPSAHGRYKRWVSLARAGRERELLRAWAAHAGVSGARRVGTLQGSRLVAADDPDRLTAADFRVILVAWQLPDELGGRVVLDARLGRRRRMLVSLQPGVTLAVTRSWCSGDAVVGTELELRLAVRRGAAVRQIAWLFVDEADPEASSEAFARAVTVAAHVDLDLQPIGLVFMD